MAIKIIHSQTEWLDSVSKEIEIWEKLSDLDFKPLAFPNYYGYFKDVSIVDDIFYICFEKLPFTFYDLIQYRKSLEQPIIEAPELFSYFNILVNGLSFLQALKICHRDLKPKNISFPVIIDFGVSKQLSVSSTIQQQILSKVNITIEGTKKYMSSEFENSLEENDYIKINPWKSDSFSMGLVFYKFWTTKPLSNKLEQNKIDQDLHNIENEITKVKDIEEKSKLIKILKF